MYAQSFIEITKQTLRFYRSFRERKGLTVTGKNRPSGLACDNMAEEHTTHAKCEREKRQQKANLRKRKTDCFLDHTASQNAMTTRINSNNQKTKRPPKKRALGRLVRISEVEGWSIVNKFTRTSRMNVATTTTSLPLCESLWRISTTPFSCDTAFRTPSNSSCAALNCTTMLRPPIL